MASSSSSKVCRLSSKIHSLTQRLRKTNVHVSSIPSPIKSSLPTPPRIINPSFRSSFFLSLSPVLNALELVLIVMICYRVPVELSSCVSLFPLHSAIASSRLVSSLSAESMSWGLVPQGHSSLSHFPRTYLVHYHLASSSGLKNEALLYLYLK